MKHDTALRAKSSLQLIKLPRPPIEPILRRRRKGPGFLSHPRRAPKPPTATGILGIGGADQPAEHRGVFCVTGAIGEVHPEQGIKFLRELQHLEFDRNQPVTIGIELVVLVDLPLNPPGIQCCLRAHNDREPTVFHARLTLGLELAGPTLPFVEPNAQAVHLHEYPSERLDALGVVVIVTEENVELPHRRLPCGIRRDQRVVRRSLIQVRQEPVLQRNRSGPRARFQPACRRGNQGAPGLRDGMADRGPPNNLAVEPVKQQPRGLDMHGVPHGKHAAHARLDQTRRN